MLTSCACVKEARSRQYHCEKNPATKKKKKKKKKIKKHKNLFKIIYDKLKVTLQCSEKRSTRLCSVFAASRK